jgi:DNA polymerase elongation subunit (family B)
MLIDFEYRNQKLITSYIDENGKIKLKYMDWTHPKKYEICDSFDPYAEKDFKTWDNKAVKLVDTMRPGKYPTYEYLDALPVDEQTKIFGYQMPDMYFLDIETEIVDGFPDPVQAKTKILSIAIVNNEQILAMGLKPLSDEEIQKIETDTNTYFKKFGKNYKFKYKLYDSEYNMMRDFMYLYVPKMAVLTGWNFVSYDWQYIINRCKNYLNIDVTKTSFTGKMDEQFETGILFPKHRVIIDYMEIYKKWDTSIKVKESASLDFVSEKLLELNKINYTGSLKSLYNDDFVKFIYYNVVDTALVQLIHEQKKYINVMLGIAEMAKIRMIDSYSTINVTEGVLRNPMRSERGIVLVKDYRGQQNFGKSSYIQAKLADKAPEKIKGGWVKIPALGMHAWVGIFDFASLYPTTMREFFLAPESYKGILDPDDHTKCFFNGLVQDVEDDDFVSVNDTVFKIGPSVTVQVLTDIYNDRKKFKKLMMKSKEEMKSLERELAELETTI